MCPLLFGLLVLVLFLASRQDGTRTVSGLVITPPEGFSLTSSSTRRAVWEYKEGDRTPGVLILDEEIKGDNGQRFATADEVLQDCDWMTEAELYVNPQKIRTVRGYSMDYQGGNGRERRYYVETPHSVLLISMQEDPRYYSIEDCEEVLLQLVDSIRIP